MKKSDYVIVGCVGSEDWGILYSDNRFYPSYMYPCGEYILSYQNESVALDKLKELVDEFVKQYGGYPPYEVMSVERLLKEVPRTKAAKRLLMSEEEMGNERYYLVDKYEDENGECYMVLHGNGFLLPCYAGYDSRQVFFRDYNVARNEAKSLRGYYPYVKVMTPDKLHREIGDDIKYGETLAPPGHSIIMDEYAKLNLNQIMERFVDIKYCCDYSSVKLEEGQIMGVFLCPYITDVVIFNAEGLEQIQRRNMVIDFFHNTDLFYDDDGFSCKLVKEMGNIYFCE